MEFTETVVFRVKGLENTRLTLQGVKFSDNFTIDPETHMPIPNIDWKYIIDNLVIESYSLIGDQDESPTE